MDKPAEAQSIAIAPKPVMEYETVPKANPDAQRSLICGLLLMIPFVTGCLAIVYGRRGKARSLETGTGRRAAKAGFALGVVNLVVWSLIAVSLPSAFMRARRAAQMVQCASQLRQLSVVLIMYASQNKGWLPPSINTAWAGMVPTVCPAVPGGATNYVYATKPIQISAVRASDYVTIYEPLSNHPRGANFAFLDGHVEMIPPARAQKMINELNAGFNPPRPEMVN